MRERGGTDRQTDIDRQRLKDRHADRPRGRQRQTDRQTDRDTETHRKTETDRQIQTHRDRKTETERCKVNVKHCLLMLLGFVCLFVLFCWLVGGLVGLVFSSSEDCYCFGVTLIT